MNTPEPFDVADAVNVVITGQMCYGHAVGMRLDGIDCILMAPTYASMMRLLARLPSNAQVYGLDALDKRKVIVNESQLSAGPVPVPEVQEATMQEWTDSQMGGLG